jgi:hypothetical protein
VDRKKEKEKKGGGRRKILSYADAFKESASFQNTIWFPYVQKQQNN